MSQTETKTPTLTPGQKVLYVPCHQAHHKDRGRDGKPLFHFAHEPAPALHPAMPKAGTPAEAHHLRDFKARKDDGHPSGMPLYAVEGHGPEGLSHLLVEYRVRPVGPKHPWPATVAANPDGSLRLDVPHPSGGWTLHYDLGGPNPVKYDAAGKASHSWHLPQE